MRIDRARLAESMDTLGKIGETPRGGLNRVALTDEDRRGRDLLVRWMTEAGLRVTVDRMGNIFGERPGTEPRPPVFMGRITPARPRCAFATMRWWPPPTWWAASGTFRRESVVTSWRRWAASTWRPISPTRFRDGSHCRSTSGTPRSPTWTARSRCWTRWCGRRRSARVCAPRSSTTGGCRARPSIPTWWARCKRRRGRSAVAIAASSPAPAMTPSYMAAICPTGMIFVPSRAGRSHCEEEFTALDDIEHGANTLLLTYTKLAEAQNVGMQDLTPGGAAGGAG